MKKIISIAAVCIYCLMPLNAQIQFGIQGGLDYSTMNVELKYQDDSGIKLLPTFHLGLISGYRINNNFSLKTGLLLYQKGFNQEINDLDSITKFRVSPYYIEVPVLTEFRIKVRKTHMSLGLGPYFSYGIFGNIDLDIVSNSQGISYSENIRWSKYDNFMLPESEVIVHTYGYSKIKRVDYGATVEFGLEFEPLIFSIRYSYGLANLMWEYYSNEKMNNRNIGISLTYMFSPGKNIKNPEIM